MKAIAMLLGFFLVNFYFAQNMTITINRKTNDIGYSSMTQKNSTCSTNNTQKVKYQHFYCCCSSENQSEAYNMNQKKIVNSLQV